MLGSVVSVLVRLVELGGSAVGVRHGTEEPRYTVERHCQLEVVWTFC